MKKIITLNTLLWMGITVHSQCVIPPTAVCQDITTYLDGTGNFTINDSDLDGGSSLNCGTAMTFSASQTTFACSDISNTITVTGDDLIISGAYDAGLSGGTPKGIELFVINDIADLSIYGIGSANNGGGSDGEEFTFPVVAVSAGTYIYVASEAVQFNSFFGFSPDYTSGSMGINGDDAVELFKNGSAIDVFGDINTDGSGQSWEYMDGWAIRNNSTVTNNGNFNDLNWTFSGTNALDNETTNLTAVTPIPVGTHTSTGSSSTPGTLVTLTVSESVTNLATCTSIITVLDTLAPTVTCIGGTPNFELDATGNLTLTTTDIDNGSIDNCSPITLSISPSTFTCTEQGLNSVTLYGEDIYGNIDSCTMDIMVNASNVVSISNLATTDALCTDDCNGTITVTNTGANDFSIDGGITTQPSDSFLALCAGDYSILVTSLDGCIDSMSTTINNPSALTTSFVVVNELCLNDSIGEINMTVAGGTAPYQFDWSNDGTGDVDDLEDIINLASGTYTIEITDANGCTVNADTTITTSTQIVASFVVINETCLNDSIGEIDMTVSGGAGNYTYEWTTSLLTTEDLTNLSAGTYVVEITDADGCTVNADTTILAGLDIDLTYTVTANTIESNSTVGTFEWVNCIDNSIITNEIASSYTADQNGSYAIIISMSGCMDTTECIEIGGIGFEENTTVDFNVFPNPTLGDITINISNASNTLVQIIDINGKLIIAKQVNNTSNTFDLSNYENGIYFVKVKTNNQLITKKINLIK
jgi:hypothetical protein